MIYKCVFAMEQWRCARIPLSQVAHSKITMKISYRKWKRSHLLPDITLARFLPPGVCPDNVNHHPNDDCDYDALICPHSAISYDPLCNGPNLFDPIVDSVLAYETDIRIITGEDRCSMTDIGVIYLQLPTNQTLHAPSVECLPDRFI